MSVKNAIMQTTCAMQDIERAEQHLEQAQTLLSNLIENADPTKEETKNTEKLLLTITRAQSELKICCAKLPDLAWLDRLNIEAYCLTDESSEKPEEELSVIEAAA